MSNTVCVVNTKAQKVLSVLSSRTPLDLEAPLVHLVFFFLPSLSSLFMPSSSSGNGLINISLNGFSLILAVSALLYFLMQL